LVSKPQLAAFTGFHGTTSPLHRAAAAGHLSTCKAIIELIKSKIVETEEAVNNGKQRSFTLKRWKSLLKTVLDQRSHRGQTPMMLACEAGHADITSYLLSEGADALAVDMFHCRTALHYAAAGGHAQCIKVLCSDSTFVLVDGAQRLLRDVVTDDLQVRSAKFIDQRSSGGLTALHFAAVSGHLDTLQALLKAGAAIMVKTDSEAFIGQEYLTSGSTPLHIAVIVGSIPLAHALLQAHAEMMTVISLGRDERHRRPWEGHSRSDIRSVRNSARKLPYHIARDKQWNQMMHLIDPRISVDAALDAARDTDHGIGPKNLATICSLVLQTSLLHWLDQTETEIEAGAQSEKVCEEQHQAVVALPSPFAGAAEVALEGVVGAVQEENSITQMPATPRAEDCTTLPNNEITTATSATNLVTASAPAIPALSMQSMGSLHTYLGMLCTRRPSPFDSADSPLNKHGEESNEQTSSSSASRLRHHQRSATLAYGDLTRLAPTDSLPATTATGVGASLTSSPATATRSSSFTLRSRGLPRASSTGNLLGRSVGPLQLAFPGPTDGTVVVNVRLSGGRPSAVAAVGGANNTTGDSLRAMNTNGSDDDGNCINDHHHHENCQHQQTAATAQPQQGGTMRRVLSTLREKIKSSDGSSSGEDLTSYGIETGTSTTENNITEIAATALNNAAADGASADGGGSTVHSHAGKGCFGSSEDCNTGTTTTRCHDSAGSSSSDEYDVVSGTSSADIECGVCLDNGVQVAFSGCEHALCLQCARNLTKQEKKPPSCPFCRRMVVGFVKVNS
jgi:ankyrin repeat protein